MRAVSAIAGVTLTAIGVYGLLTGDGAATAPGAAALGTTAAAPSESGSAIRACANPEIGYVVDIPDEWFDGGTGDDGPCRFFHPEPFEIPEFGEVSVAIAIYWIPGTLTDLTSSLGDSSIFVVIERERLEVAGRRAVRVHYEHGPGGVEPGAESYDVLVAWKRGVLAITAFEPYSADFARTRRVADAIVASLREAR